MLYFYSYVLGKHSYSQQNTFSQGLTQVEEMLISAVMPIMSLYRLPQEQYGYTGHVVNLPQDVASFAQSLPVFKSAPVCLTPDTEWFCACAAKRSLAEIDA